MTNLHPLTSHDEPDAHRYAEDTLRQHRQAGLTIGHQHLHLAPARAQGTRGQGGRAGSEGLTAVTDTALPEPLVLAAVDLRDFAFMPLDVVRLRDSDLAALEPPEACWAAVLRRRAWYARPLRPSPTMIASSPTSPASWLSGEGVAEATQALCVAGCCAAISASITPWSPRRRSTRGGALEAGSASGAPSAAASRSTTS